MWIQAVEMHQFLGNIHKQQQQIEAWDIKPPNSGTGSLPTQINLDQESQEGGRHVNLIPMSGVSR